MSDHSVIDYNNIQRSVTGQLGSDCVGWIQIVTSCFEDIKERCDKEELDYPRVFQIKQKLRQLRIYLHQNTDGHPKFVGRYIEAACSQADRSCEVCGNDCRQQWIGSWVRNLCAFCAHQDAERKKMKLHKQPLNRGFDHRMQCSRCGYIGQIVPGGSKCVACVVNARENQNQGKS